MACAEYGYFVGIFLHPVECDMPGDFHAGFGGTCMFISMKPFQDVQLLICFNLGAFMALLQLRFRTMDVLDDG